MKIIKRYQNRKLYDTSDSCYITLEEISEMIKQGEEVQIIDNTTKEDLTSVTLAQIIFEEQKNKTRILPLDMFKEIIRSSEEVIRGFVNKTIQNSSKEIEHVRKFYDGTIKPAVANVHHLSDLQHEILDLQKKIDALEKKVKDRDIKG